jgi:hypothetical protein
MSSFVQNAEAKMQLEAYQNQVRFFSDVDSFTELSTLTLSQARDLIKMMHVNNPQAIELFGPKPLTIAVGKTVQYEVLLQREKSTFSVPTYGNLKYRVTATSTWKPLNNKITIVNGLVTGAIIGATSFYVQLGGLITETVTVTVVA